jgi:hypothetical protein
MINFITEATEDAFFRALSLQELSVLKLEVEV